MFTGIVNTAKIISVAKSSNLMTIAVEPAFELKAVLIGGSYSVDGVCLTALDQSTPSRLVFNIVQATLKDTTLGDLSPDETVNFEESLAYGAAVGGHLLSGHVDGTGSVVETVAMGEGSSDQRWITIKVPDSFARYLFIKGYIAVDGTSLTVQSVEGSAFKVNLIPHTLGVTKFCNLKVGSRVNLEFDHASRTIMEVLHRFETRVIEHIEDKISCLLRVNS